MHYPHKWTEKWFFYSVVSQISILSNKGFLLGVVLFPPTFLQKPLLFKKFKIILSEVGMDILGTIYKSRALKYQVEGNRIKQKNQ